jgi:hypothetical protein
MSAAGAINLRELFDGKLTNLAKKEDAPVSDVEGKVVALYFSAHVSHHIKHTRATHTPHGSRLLVHCTLR